LGIGYSTLKQWIHDGYARSTTTAGGHHRLSDAEIERLASHGGARSVSTRAARDPLYIEGLSARNRLRGFVEEVRVEGLLAQVRIRIGDQRLTAVITRDAIDELRLRRGDDAIAIIKSTEVMIARVSPLRSAERPRRRHRR
jgi:molybdopterin-binding protein